MFLRKVHYGEISGQEDNKTMYNDSIQPVEMVILQGTSLCNLNCSYCDLTEESRKQNQFVPLDVLEKVFTKLFQSAYLGKKLEIVWHAGEPLTMPIDYYKQAWKLIDQLKARHATPCFQLSHHIQTNGTLLNQDWCDLFLEYKGRLTIGVSCDGPAFLHDSYRVNWQGQKNHAKVIAGIELIKSNGLPFRLNAVITPKTLDYPNEFFDFFYQYRHDVCDGIEMGFVTKPSSNHELFRYSEEVEKKYRLFLQVLLERMKKAPEPLNILPFSRFFSMVYYLPEEGESYTAAYDKQPLRTLNIDVQGNVSTFIAGLGVSTDHPQNIYGDQRGFIIGNLLQENLEDMVQSSKFQAMCRDFESSVEACRASCDYFDICGGGNPVLKYEQNGTFDSTETWECRVQVQAFADTVLADINQHLEAKRALAQELVTI